MRNSIFTCCPTRAFELLLGSSLAFVEHDGKRFFAPWCYLFGLAVVFFCIFGFGRVPKESFPGLWALLPCIGTALCIYGGTSAKETWAGRILSGRVMAGIGLISYSLYLYHWPFLVFFRADKSGTRVRHMGTSSCIRRCFRALLPVLFFC